SGRKALAIARESRGDIPFIFISGTIGENVAVDMMKAGADDYVMKNNLARLLPALERELREAEVRRGRSLAEERLHESEAALHRAHVMAKIAHVVTGLDGSFERWSDTLPLLIGVEPAQMPRSTREWLDLLHPDDREGFRATAIEAVRTGMRKDVEYRLRRADGEWSRVRQVIEPLQSQADAEGGARWFSTLQDVTEHRLAEEKILRLTRVYAVLSGINGLIVRVRDRDELFRDACRVAVEAGKFKLAWVGVVDREAALVKPIAWHGGEDDYFQLMPLALNESDPERYGLAGRAIRERRAMVVEDMAKDPRVLLRKEASVRGFHSLVVLPLLVSGEAVGRLAGDELLKQVAERIEGHAGPIRMARISADRFAIVRTGVSSESEVARLIEQWLAECFAPPYMVSGTELRVSAKAGVALFPNDGADADALFQNAEAALKKAKATGERYLFH